MNGYIKISLLLALVCGIIFLTFIGANYIEGSGTVQEIIQSFGIFGILIVAIIAGLNLFVPIHAATFTPVFTAAGFGLPIIIVMLVIGTTIADLIGYFLGRLGTHATGDRIARIQTRIRDLVMRHPKLVPPIIFFYAIFAPLPNEILLIPLGLIGYKIKQFIIPLILGTAIHQTIFALGFVSAFEALF